MEPFESTPHWTELLADHLADLADPSAAEDWP